MFETDPSYSVRVLVDCFCESAPQRFSFRDILYSARGDNEMSGGDTRPLRVRTRLRTLRITLDEHVAGDDSRQ